MVERLSSCPHSPPPRHPLPVPCSSWSNHPTNRRHAFTPITPSTVSIPPHPTSPHPASSRPTGQPLLWARAHIQRHIGSAATRSSRCGSFFFGLLLPLLCAPGRVRDSERCTRPTAETPVVAMSRGVLCTEFTTVPLSRHRRRPRLICRQPTFFFYFSRRLDRADEPRRRRKRLTIHIYLIECCTKGFRHFTSPPTGGTSQKTQGTTTV